MAEVKIQKGTEVFQMFQDYWTLIQRLWGVEKSGKYFEQVIHDCDLFVKKYSESKFSIDLAVSLMNELDRRAGK